jgi:hypothetical protein
MSALTIYKKTGAVRFSADPLRGVIFVSFARPLDRKISEGQETQRGRRKYRWEEKVTIALDPSEASIIGAFARLVLSGNTPQKNPVIHHTPEKFGKKGPEKTIRIDKKAEGFALEIEVRGEKITVGPIGFSDFYLIDAFLTRFIPDILPKPRIAVPPSVEAEVPREEPTEEVETPEEILF